MSACRKKPCLSTKRGKIFCRRKRKKGTTEVKHSFSLSLDFEITENNKSFSEWRFVYCCASFEGSILYVALHALRGKEEKATGMCRTVNILVSFLNQSRKNMTSQGVEITHTEIISSDSEMKNEVLLGPSNDAGLR